MNAPSPAKPDRTWLYVGLAFVAFWGVYLTFFAPKITSPGPSLGGAAVGRPADFGWTLSDLGGHPVEFSRYKGKTIFLNVWATWCGPCVQELPSIARLAADPTLKDVAFLCVSVDDAPARAKQFLSGKNWPMTGLHAEALPPVFTTRGIPATFIIAPDGTIAASEVGSADWDAPEVVSLLQGLAKKAK